MSPKVKELLELLDEYPQLTIVSYGLAPRPNGFCYEYDDAYYGEMPQHELDRFARLLEEISNYKSLSDELKKEVL